VDVAYASGVNREIKGFLRRFDESWSVPSQFLLHYGGRSPVSHVAHCRHLWKLWRSGTFEVGARLVRSCHCLFGDVPAVPSARICKYQICQIWHKMRRILDASRGSEDNHGKHF
jgi:hypothetical protein